MVLEEGRGGFMNAFEYRQTMTDMFFLGKMPDAKPEAPKPGGGKRTPRRPTKSSVDELRAMHEQIASRRRPSEVASPPSGR